MHNCLAQADAQQANAGYCDGEIHNEKSQRCSCGDLVCTRAVINSCMLRGNGPEIFGRFRDNIIKQLENYSPGVATACRRQ